MTRLDFVDRRAEPAGWARDLGISREAVELYIESDVIDLHVDTFIWNRIFGYDLLRRHGRGPFDARFLGQADLPRLREAAVGGATWVVTTNPLRSAAGRRAAILDNLERLCAIFARAPDDVAVVRNAAEYRAARTLDRHAAFIGIQGGNALDADPAVVDELPEGLVLRVTLVHLSSSSLGTTSSPLGRAGAGLTVRGKELVQRLEAKKIFADLAHVSRLGFFDAVSVHDRTQPLIVTHTGVAGVHPHWRNLDDEQLRAIADTGGTVGVMYQSSFLGDSPFGGRAASIVDHLAHIVKSIGEDHASLGSDWDGAIVTPRDLPTCLELPRLVEIMLRRGWTAGRIRKILGGNFLRVVAALRG